LFSQQWQHHSSNFAVNSPARKGLNFILQVKNKSAEATMFVLLSEFEGYLVYNADTNVPLPVHTWWRDPSFHDV